ncbi:hypothetical protein BDW_02335 [Bdellovibrio bacteriovorus W]|nr:hypothetical protein BDW_02335 [Bdellovibrio bacteriovorus W]
MVFNIFNIFFILFLVGGCTNKKSANTTKKRMSCGTLSTADCDRIYEWFVEYHSYPERITGVWTTYNNTDAKGENVAFREFKGYCKDASWPASVCQSKVTEFLKNYEAQLKVENDEEEARQKREADKSAERDRLLGY